MNTMIQSPLRSFFIALLTILIFTACKDETSVPDDQPFSVTARIPAEPDKLNPLITFQAYSRVVNEQLFQYLLQFDPETLQMVPQLATSRAEVSENTEGPYVGGVAYTFEIRPEARWDDGQPVTAEDVAFSLKALFHPEITPPAIRSYFDAFKHIEIDPDNPKKFTIYSNQTYMLGEAALGGIAVMPAHIYDEAGVLKDIPLSDMSDEAKATELLGSNSALSDFAASFTSTERSHDPALINGSGPYRLAEWESGQFIRLERKQDWWADDAKDKNLTITAYPTELIFKIITDQTTAVNALQAEEVEVAAQVDSRSFVRLQEDTSFTNRFNLFTPLAFQIYYIGFNTRLPKLADPKVRKALAHALDVDNVIENLFGGLAERIVAPFHPSQPYYHSDLPLIDFNFDTSKELLAEAGWEDTNGNGTVDKVIDGQLTELSLSFLTSTSSQFGRDMALFYQEALKNIGVELVIDAKEFGAVRDDFRRLDFEVFAGAWALEPIPDDPKQLWHTENAAPGGSNRMGFGNAETDELIAEIRSTLDPDLRNQMMRRLQEIIFDAQPGIFLFAPQERIVIHKKFDGEATPLRPGFFVNDFQLKKD
ncbi:ABC transporter substrate-binding protein [Flavilitoribacter nigricans]|uniref:ABC transporter substrate-binding protein n=1 Tax=Flavilitoribacter nigricans (strain ATCC 23147 / DSM 23189 / NBRC 102662 / NCIMB 1420 / SS-2) TaxID=1122177 RepID=A0A2D0NFL6_FLAN2|nr:ABC transporter substrate-binding protein [Flavilitoribacter nigricans]PHN07166.1 ABC transporter substrate-binding protein [Flavilitoribacter nigricans DSM 23189 = NBRC 102662]